MSRSLSFSTSRPLSRSMAPRILALASATLFAGACSSASNPMAPKGSGQQSQSERPSVPDFVYVSDASGTPQIYRFSDAGSVRITFDNSTDDHPHSAAGRLVFTSYRDDDPEIYIAQNDGSALERLTHSEGLDDEAKLDPTGARIVFVSDRGGVMRLFTMDSTGANQAPLATGAESWVPERAPAWSPNGSQIAFTSLRSGISQVWVVPATGGAAVQLTHETGGAFDPAWSADGTQIYFVSGTGTPYLRTVDVATGTSSDVERDTTSLGQPTCTASQCLVVSGAYGDSGQIVSYSTTGGAASSIVATTANETSPAFLVP